MACFKPKTCWFPHSGGRPIFKQPPGGFGEYRRGSIPCRNCVGCKGDYAKQWGVRVWHEAQMHEQNCFLTLTYADWHMPRRQMLVPRDLQLFIKRLRNWVLRKGPGGEIKFFAVGEYGGRTNRPHYHVCVFGLQFPDLRVYKQSHGGHTMFSSKILDELWGKGICTINDLTPETANYCARYSVKKRTPDGVADDAKWVRKADRYWRRDPVTGERYRWIPEFARMSRGIGRAWLEKFHTDIFRLDSDGRVTDTCYLPGGQQTLTPEFYLRELRKWCEDDYLSLKDRRKEAFFDNMSENMPDRLQARRLVAQARMSRLVREGV